MTKILSVLGSTGSIGRQTLEVARSMGIEVAAISGNQNIDLLEEQARAFAPSMVAVADEKAAAELRQRLLDTNIQVRSGMEGLLEAATWEKADTVLTAVVGMVGLSPTLAAIEAGKTIALANKETLVCAGQLVMERARAKGVDILPVDSEHSAIFQCLQGQRREDMKGLILTASGGPFFGMNREQLAGVTKDMALKHPNWAMGPKITVDSATLMNKGLEFIEAMHLFSARPEEISILVHRESIIHSMVEFRDGAVLAQLGVPDMRLPIGYALTYPKREAVLSPPPDLRAIGKMTFSAPDTEAFGCLRLAMAAAKDGGAACTVLNAANEVAVALFLEGRCSFLDIERIVEKTLEAMERTEAKTLSDILETDRWARETANWVFAHR